MKSKTYRPGSHNPVWLEEGHRINEAVFCETFMSKIGRASCRERV